MAIKDASHVFGWANTWNPLNGLCSLVHFARELFGSSHIFASVSRKLNRIDVTGEKLSSACRHIRGSQKKLCQTGQQWMLFLPPPTPKCFNSLMDAAAANSPSPWRDDAGLAWRTRKLQTEKALATRGFEPLLSAGLQCKPPSHSQPNYPKWKEILTWRCYKTNLLFNVSFLTEKKEE